MPFSQLLSSQLPTSEDFQPIIQQMRSKYGLPELSPGDDPITEIYLDDKQISLEDFRRDIFALVRADLCFLPSDIASQCNNALTNFGKPFADKALPGLRAGWGKSTA